jgi:UDP-glucose 4-epimerase
MEQPTKKTILVTGAAGFIGSHAVDRLLAAGHRVIGIDNLLLGTKANLETAFKHADFTYIEADMNKPHEVLSAVKQFVNDGIDSVWHLAANSDIQKGVENPAVDLADTFMTTFNTLAIMQELGVKKLVFASTSAMYGEKSEILTEDMGPLFPISSYGAMKLASEAIISAALEKYLEKVWIFRFPNVVGSRATHGATQIKSKPKRT